MKPSETGAQRRARERVENVIALEKKTRALVESEQATARLREEVDALRAALINSIGKPHKKPTVPETILATARVVEQGWHTAKDVARVLEVTVGCARMRLRRAVAEHLIEQTGRGRYYVPGATEREEAQPTQ